MDLVFLTNIERQYTMLEQVRQRLARQGRMDNNGKTVLLKTEMPWNLRWEQKLTNARLIVFSLLGTSRDLKLVQTALQFVQAKGIDYVVLASAPEPEDTSSGVTPEEQGLIEKYLLYSGNSNYENLWLWLEATYCGQAAEWKYPEPLCWNGIYHPRSTQHFRDITAYQEKWCYSDRPTVGVIFPRDEWIWSDLAYVQALIEELEKQEVNAVAVFSTWGRIPEAGVPGIEDTVKHLFYKNGVPIIDVLINTIKFSLTSGRPEEQEFLHQLNVPVLQAYTLIQPCSAWQDSIAGLTSTEIICMAAMPEFDGVIHTVPIAGKEHLTDGTTRHQMIPERVSHVVNKAKRWAKLRHKDNSNKKIAIIFHNYPPNNSSIGSAVGLDTPQSVCLLLDKMAELGYRLDFVPADGERLMQEILAQATNDQRFLTEQQLTEAPGHVPKEVYQRWFEGFPLYNQQQLTNDWGEPPGEVFQYEQQLLIPGLINGNILISVQPPRGFGEEPGKIYHSPDLAPPHHYLAYYHWIRDIWQADAVIHVGTHGSLEWLPGKGAGLSKECYSDLVLGDLPNVYPYLITIVGEGIQAKRRGAACLIGHMTPPVSRADTYGGLTELEKLLDDYAHFQQNQHGNAAVAIELIRDKAVQLNLQQEVPELPGQSLDEYLQRLHAYITDLKHMQIRVGLHVLGCAPQKETLNEYIFALTNLQNGEVPSLPQTIAAAYGYDYYTLLEQSCRLTADGSKTYGILAEEVRCHSKEVITYLAKQFFSDEKAEKCLELPWMAAIDPQIQQKLLAVVHYICQRIVPALRKTEQEITNTLKALDGQFVEPAPAGAPTSGMADILPTGRNFYGVDPSALPSPVAWEVGKRLADQVIERFIAEEGRYPEEIGMILWSGGNMRSQGQCVAEFLYLLGVCPVWQCGSQRVIGLTVIPLVELKRPRIDVTARISGLFRDTLPDSVTWMDKAVAMVAALDESPEENYIRKHVLEDVAAMESDVDGSHLWEQACCRIFGCPPGTYGAGVGHLLEEKNWQTVDDLAAGYIRWSAHAYSVKERGRFVPQLFSRRMSKLDITVKNEDNREVHMLNSDDFNAYHGGMIATVRSLQGKAPRSYCGDTADRQRVMLRSLEEEARRLFRGELLNPKYIEGMMRHGYKGAADLAGVVAHSFGWDATSAVMDDWMYEALAQEYALNNTMQEWMKRVNPWALQRMAETLLEASQRGLWHARAETKRELEQLYLSIEGELEERS